MKKEGLLYEIYMAEKLAVDKVNAEFKELITTLNNNNMNDLTVRFYLTDNESLYQLFDSKGKSLVVATDFEKLMFFIRGYGLAKYTFSATCGSKINRK